MVFRLDCVRFGKLSFDILVKDRFIYVRLFSLELDEDILG